MRKFKTRKISLVVFTLAALVVGCGREQVPSPAIPTVIATSPANGANGVATNTTVSADFSSVMNPSTINTTTFTLTGPGATPVTGVVSYAGTTAIFTPTVGLAANTPYIATVTTGARDTSGIALAANFVWNFTTAPPATVISTIPANGATAVPVNTEISATFSEAMNPATINAATFTLTGPGATPVAGTVTYAGTSATFTPTAILATDTLYMATITTGAKDLTGAALAASFVWTFTTAAPPMVISTIPVNGTTTASLNTTISATFSRAMNPMTINAKTFTLTGPGAAPVAGTVTYAGITATFRTLAVLTTGTSYTATITTGAKDPTGAALVVDFVWTFTAAVPPTVVSTIPANGAIGVAVDAAISATFSEAMDPATITAATFTLTGPGATPVAGTVSHAGTTATFTPMAVLATGTLYMATITTGAKNPVGTGLAANFVWTYTTVGAPTVLSTVPVNGTTGVAVNTAISATFSKAMNPATINAATLTITGPGATPVNGTVSYSGNTGTFTPTAVLANSTVFTATITTGAQDLAGHALLANFVWSFTTAAPPTVVSTIPVNGAITVAVNTAISAIFSEAMNPATISAATFTLTGPGATPVAGTVTYAGTTATFTPSAILTTSTLYTATIATGAKDSAGAPLAANAVWTFTTAPPATVVSIIPANGATAVAVNTAISATFSEAMNPATIIAATFTLTGPGAMPVAGTVTYAGTTATFSPTAVLSTSTLYTATITIGARDPAGTALAANFVWTFTTAAPASVVSTGPANGAVAVPVNTVVSATFSEAMNPATINPATFTLAGPGATPVAGTVTYAGTTATFTPTATLAPGTLYTATITTGARDSSGVGLAANYVWTFGTIPSPSIVSTIPVNGATAVAVNTAVSANFSQAMDPATITAATFTLAGPGATPVSGIVTYAGTTATFTPTAVLTTSTSYTATITTGAKNPAGVALAANYAWTFTTAPPATVVSTIPINGATGVAINTAISTTFSEAMNPATINAATFTLSGPGATLVSGTVSYAGTTATFTPTALLATSTLYTATITTGAKDPGGAALATNFVWTFTTAVPPTVVSTTPANGATTAAVNTAASATFSEDMNPATINAATFTLTGPGTTPVAGTVSYAGTVATFTPAAILTTSTLYTATITTGAKDPTGAPLPANFVWTFTTAAPPTVISTVPANGAMAAINTAVSATFSRAMNPATITTATFTLTGSGATPVGGAVTYSGTTATFTPSALLATGILYTATITTGAKDLTGAALAANFTWTFTTAVPPTVVSTIPANGATAVAVNTPISATFSEAMDQATITSTTFTLTGPGATPVSGTVSYAGSTATFTPAVVLTTSTLYMATITTGAKDPTGAALAANFVWTFTTAPPPTVVSTIPANGATAVAVNTPISATFSEAMDQATITATTFTVAGPGTTSVGGTVSYSGSTATFTPTAVLATGVLFTATITTGAKDPAGIGLTANYVWTFTTELAPKISFTTPAGGATNIPINQKIAATFNTPMNASTITATGTFTLEVTSGGAAVPGPVTFDAASNTAILAPTGALAVSTQYTATVTTAAQSAPGTALAANYIWSFTTGIDSNAGAPRVTSTNPASAAMNVPINQKIAATFSEPMDPATISASGIFTVAETSSGTAVTGAIVYDAASNTAVFTPASAFSGSTEFTATITTGAADLTGVAIGANFVWSFTTGSTADAVAPTITGTNPASAVLNVSLNKTINATFSKAIDPKTITSATFSLVVAGVGGVPVDGTVSYDPTSQIATFKPAANLTTGTQYTAMISNLVTDLFGNALASGVAPNPWTFTTGSALGPTLPDLGAASTFGGFGGGAGITSTGTNTVINGDLGTTGGSTLITGFHDAGTGCDYTITGANSGFVNGKIYTNVPPPTGACPSEGTAVTFAIATQAAGDALTAFNNLAGEPAGPDPGAGQLGGLTLTPGTYTSAGGSFTITGSDLTLNAQGDVNAIWVFQMATTLIVGAPGFPRSVILVNGAQPKNIFWQVGSAATINGAGGGTMVGNIIAPAGVTFSTAGNAPITTLNGRAIGLNASVTMVNTVINVPSP